jgi:hypothetical protein
MDPYGATDNCSFDIGCSFIKRRYLFSPGKRLGTQIRAELRLQTLCASMRFND